MKAITLDPSQQRAVDLVCRAQVGIVTGGPGTGKSTCLKYALDRLDREGETFELAAPTGKAAKRLNETTGRPARTIHRLLEYHPQHGFRRNDQHPLECGVVVVDESSMIDIELADSLCSAIAPGTRLILIGDADQLPPVGPGRFFGDLVDADAVPLVRLQQLHRSAEQSWIHQNAPKLLRGTLPDLTGRKDFRFVETPEVSQILPTVRHLLTKVMVEEIDEPVTQLLIPIHGGKAGIDAANGVLQEALNPRAPNDDFMPRGDFELRVGDRVIQTRNDYELEVFNGEIGDVLELGPKWVRVQFEGRGVVEYELRQAKGLQLAYALTVHRSQGSEFAWVIFVCHSTHAYSLNPQLAYTAITRAREGVILVGDKKGLRHAVSGKRLPKRNTTLIERLHGDLEPAYSPLLARAT